MCFYKYAVYSATGGIVCGCLMNSVLDTFCLLFLIISLVLLCCGSNCMHLYGSQKEASLMKLKKRFPKTLIVWRNAEIYWSSHKTVRTLIDLLGTSCTRSNSNWMQREGRVQVLFWYVMQSEEKWCCVEDMFGRGDLSRLIWSEVGT